MKVAGAVNEGGLMLEPNTNTEFENSLLYKRFSSILTAVFLLWIFLKLLLFNFLSSAKQVFPYTQAISEHGKTKYITLIQERILDWFGWIGLGIAVVAFSIKFFVELRKKK